MSRQSCRLLRLRQDTTTLMLTINRYLAHSDGLTNYQRRWGVKYNSAICNFSELVFADVKHITNQILAIRNQEQKVEGIWLGETMNNGEHIIALKNNEGSIYYTRSLSRMTPDQQWNKELFNTIAVPMMDATMKSDNSEKQSLGSQTSTNTSRRSDSMRSRQVAMCGPTRRRCTIHRTCTMKNSMNTSTINSSLHRRIWSQFNHHQDLNGGGS
eukprot:1117797-Amphidinium_carterae.3